MKNRMRIVASLAVLAASVLVIGVESAGAVPPSLVAPERLYFSVNSIANAMTGTDTISDDVRDLTVTATSSGCNPTNANNYAIALCARIQMRVFHGELAVDVDTLLGGALQPDGIASGGAIIDSSTNGDGTGAVVNLNGTATQINAALDTLTYTPDLDYEYKGSNPETLDLTVVDGDPLELGIVDRDVEIRVEGDNATPVVTVGADRAVTTGSTTAIPAVAPSVGTNGDFYFSDSDIEEGESDDYAVLVMFSTCGQFSLRGGVFAALGTSIPGLLAGSPLNLPADAAFAVQNTLPLNATSYPYTAGSVMDPHTGLAGVADIDEINYALSQVTFYAPASGAVCDVYTAISDIGNNGLPTSYVGSPIGGADMPQPGYEVPDAKGDFGTTTFVVGEGVTLSIPATASVNEGGSYNIPVTFNTAVHPLTSLQVTVASGTATLGADFDQITGNPVAVASGVDTVNILFQPTNDSDPESDETLTATLALVGTPPDGVSLSAATQTITIVDDDTATTTTTTTSTTTTTAPTTTTTTAPTTTTTDPNATTTTTDPTTTTTTAPTTTTTAPTTTTTDPTTTTTTAPTTTTTTAPTTTTTTDPTTTTTTAPTTTTTTAPTTTTTGPTTTTTTAPTTTTTSGPTTTTAPTTTTDPSATTTDPSATTTTTPGATTTTAPGSTTTDPGPTVPTPGGTTTSPTGGSTTTDPTGTTAPSATTDPSGTTDPNGTITVPGDPGPGVTVPGTVDPGGVGGIDGSRPGGYGGSGGGVGGSGLARTGPSLFGPLVIGLALIVVGLASVRVSRRQQ